MSGKYIYILPFLFCACSSEQNESTDPEEGMIEIVEVCETEEEYWRNHPEYRMDQYDEAEDKWYCDHEGTAEEIRQYHLKRDMDPDDPRWVFRKLKK